MLICKIFSCTIFLTRDVSSTKQNISSFFAVLCIEETSITFASILYIIPVHKLGVFPPFHPMSPFTTTRPIYCERKLETGCRNSSLRCLYSGKKDFLPRLKKFQQLHPNIYIAMKLFISFICTSIIVKYEYSYNKYLINQTNERFIIKNCSLVERY